MKKHKWEVILKDVDVCERCGVAKSKRVGIGEILYFDPSTEPYLTRSYSNKRPDCIKNLTHK